MSEAVKLDSNSFVDSPAGIKGGAQRLVSADASIAPLRQNFLALLTLSTVFCLISFYIARRPEFFGGGEFGIYALCAISVAVVLAPWLFSGAVLKGFVGELSDRRPGISLLFLLSLASLTAANLVEVFSSSPAHLFANPLSASPIVALLMCGIALLRRVFGREASARSGLRILDICPATTVLDVSLGQGQGADVCERSSDTARLKIGEIIRVKAGGIIPADGMVIGGIADVLERRFSGRGIPRIRCVGQPVCGGSRVQQGSIDIRLEALPADSAYEYFAEAAERGAEGSEVKLSGWAGLLIAAAGVCALLWRDLGGHGAQALYVFSAICAAGAALPMFRLPSVGRRLLGAAMFKSGTLPAGQGALSKLGAVKNIAIDYDENETPGRQVESFRIVDERIDEDGFAGLILGAVSSSDDAIYRALSDYLRRDRKEIRLVSLSGVASFPGRGVAAQFKGGELSIGTEDFLIERGVQLNPAELISQDDSRAGKERIFVALDDDVAAEIVFGPAPILPRRAIAEARGAAKIFILSRSGGAAIDEKGRAAGVELHQIYGALSHHAYIDKLRFLAPCAYLSTAHPDNDLIKASSASFSYFDELHWDQVLTDFVVFERDETSVVRAVRLGRAFARAERALRFAALAGLGALSVLGGAGLFSPGLVLLSAGLAASLAQEALLFDMSPKEPSQAI